MPLLRSTLLKAEPAGALASLDELFALASAMEQEAATKYSQLAEEMERQGRSELAKVFSDLAAAEREHVDGVTHWSQSRRGKAPDPALVRWQAPETFDSDASAEIRTSRLMTPYRALAIAVQNEERAFAFWSYLAAFAQDTEIKSAAEAMAREELSHVATLRKERRRAYHREHPAPRGATGGAKEVDAATLERRLAQYLAELATGMDGASAERARELSRESRQMSSQVEHLGRSPTELVASDPPMIAEALVDSYLEQAEATKDAKSLESLQRLAQCSIARLAWLRALRPLRGEQASGA
ncbi:ferritin-like domain-containing protein [Bradyrhizobium japonicum]|uniref:ferritin-like domain-containing protein n=1 Tax=Bradyrhizobium japonicum TaxID=375 RepID=UPI0004137374|nr:ferritin family protein [Bradyrhizobium japonicum]